MRILITGGGGFLARQLVPHLAGHEVVRVDLAAAPDVLAHDLTAGTGDLFDRPFDAIIHLAAIVSSEAEADLHKGQRVNIDATRALLDAAAARGNRPVFLFASSVAVFSATRNAVLHEDTQPLPLSSYGTQKVIGEFLVRDYTRRGLVAGRALRFPTIVVRPGRPNAAASSFASSIIREPLGGEPAILPVARDQRLHVLSPAGAAAAMVHALGLSEEEIGTATTITLPGLSVSVDEMIASLARHGGDPALIRHAPDPAIERIVATWPGGIETPRALALGFRAEPDFDAVLRASLPLLARV